MSHPSWMSATVLFWLAYVVVCHAHTLSQNPPPSALEAVTGDGSDSNAEKCHVSWELPPVQGKGNTIWKRQTKLNDCWYAATQITRSWAAGKKMKPAQGKASWTQRHRRGKWVAGRPLSFNTEEGENIAKENDLVALSGGEAEFPSLLPYEARKVPCNDRLLELGVLYPPSKGGTLCLLSTVGFRRTWAESAKLADRNVAMEVMCLLSKHYGVLMLSGLYGAHFGKRMGHFIVINEIDANTFRCSWVDSSKIGTQPIRKNESCNEVFDYIWRDDGGDKELDSGSVLAINPLARAKLRSMPAAGDISDISDCVGPACDASSSAELV